MMRFNHIEVTVPTGFVADHEKNLTQFMLEELAFQRSVFPGLAIPHLIFTTDSCSSQFLFIAESDSPVIIHGDDHLGLHVDEESEVLSKLERCKKWRDRDPRMEIRALDLLDLEATTTRAFYVRYLLPIWFDVQHIKYKPGFEPSHEWRFVPIEREGQHRGVLPCPVAATIS